MLQNNRLRLSLCLSLIFLGGAQLSTAQDTALDKTPSPYTWHDGAKGGAYGIGEGWSIDLLPAEYETVRETISYGGPGHFASVTYSVPAEYDWVKDERIICPQDPEMTLKLVVIPATYKTITETHVVEPAKVEYELIAPVFHKDKTLKTCGRVEKRDIKAVTEQRDRRVIDSRETTVQRLMPVDCRDGYRYVVVKPAHIIERDETRTEVRTRTSLKHAARFAIRNPNGIIAFTFDSYDRLEDFTDSLK